MIEWETTKEGQILIRQWKSKRKGLETEGSKARRWTQRWSVEIHVLGKKWNMKGSSRDLRRDLTRRQMGGESIEVIAFVKKHYKIVSMYVE